MWKVVHSVHILETVGVSVQRVCTPSRMQHALRIYFLMFTRCFTFLHPNFLLSD